MEPFEHEIARAIDEARVQDGPARILIVGETMSTASDLITRLEQRRHQCTSVQRLAEASAAIARRHYDLILLNPRLPDGDGLELAGVVQKTSPATKTIILSDDTSPDAAIDAMRHGAIDFVRVPCDMHELAARIDSALLKSRADRQREDRLSKLQKICKELNSARREISDQVDVLCNELVSAYADANAQLDSVAMTTEFRTMLRQELDIEELLRTTLEYFLTKTGPTNAAVFLPDHGEGWALGAYVNYDCPRETISFLLDHLCEAICPQMAHEQEIVRFGDASDFVEWLGVEASFLADCQIVAFSCHNNGDCLGVFVLFRNQSDPFAAQLAETIDLLRTIFAEQLATIVRVHHRAAPEWPGDAHDEEDDQDFGLAA